MFCVCQSFNKEATYVRTYLLTLYHCSWTIANNMTTSTPLLSFVVHQNPEYVPVPAHPAVLENRHKTCECSVIKTIQYNRQSWTVRSAYIAYWPLDRHVPRTGNNGSSSSSILISCYAERSIPEVHCR